MRLIFRAEDSQIASITTPIFTGLGGLSELRTDQEGFVQAFIGLGLSIGKATEKGHADYGTITGVNHGSDTSPAAASWNIFVALGSVAFAYSFVSPSLPQCSSFLFPPHMLSQAA